MSVLKSVTESFFCGGFGGKPDLVSHRTCSLLGLLELSKIAAGESSSRVVARKPSWTMTAAPVVATRGGGGGNESLQKVCESSLFMLSSRELIDDKLGMLVLVSTLLKVLIVPALMFEETILDESVEILESLERKLVE